MPDERPIKERKGFYDPHRMRKCPVCGISHYWRMVAKIQHTRKRLDGSIQRFLEEFDWGLPDATWECRNCGFIANSWGDDNYDEIRMKYEAGEIDA